MEASDFTATVACFMRLSWAAAAGRLDLVGSSQPIKESNSLFPAGIRNRLSSSGTDLKWDSAFKETQNSIFSVAFQSSLMGVYTAIYTYVYMYL